MDAFVSVLLEQHGLPFVPSESGASLKGEVRAVFQENGAGLETPCKPRGDAHSSLTRKFSQSPTLPLAQFQQIFRRGGEQLGSKSGTEP